MQAERNALNPVGVVLAEVRDMGPVTVAGIVRGTGLSDSTIRRVLRYLEGADLVESGAATGSSQRGRPRVWLATEVER